MKRSFVIATLIAPMLTGCFSLSGLSNAESDFACSPDLTPNCQSLSATHAKIERQTDVPPRIVTTEGAPVDRLAVETPLVSPKRAPEKILRIWMAPYIDEEGDLHDQHFLFTTVYRARWAPETLEISKDVNRARLLTPLSGRAPEANTIRTTILDTRR